MRNILLVCLTLFLGACTEMDEHVNATVDTLVYMPNSGLQTITAEELEDDTYKLSLYKAGYNDEVVTVELSVDQSLLDEYNESNETSYSLLPDKYYTFDEDVVLSNNKPQAFSNVKFDITAMTADGIDDSYVLPLIIISPSEDKVYEDLNGILIQIQQ